MYVYTHIYTHLCYIFVICLVGLASFSVVSHTYHTCAAAPGRSLGPRQHSQRIDCGGIPKCIGKP